MHTVVSVFGVEPRRIGGNENFARELSRQLCQRDWRSVLCFLSEPPADVRRFLDLPNVSIEVLKDSWRPSLAAARGLGKILREYSPRILHLHFVGFLSLLPWVGRLHSVERVFFTDQASRPPGYVASRAPFWKRRLVRSINRPLTGVICVSNYNYRCMTTLDVLPVERFERIYNSVDFSRVCENSGSAAGFRRKYSIPAERTIVAQVSWIMPEKGVADLLEAARRVLASDENVQFVLVGDGSHLEEYMGLAERMGIGDHVTWTGLVQDPFAEGVYSAADIVCQVSRWEEAFGWVIAEAMAYGRPVVGTTVGGIPELIEDGTTGFLVAPGDADALAEKLLTLLRDRALRKQMGCAGREAAMAKFELRRNVARVLELYGIPSCNDHDAAAAAPLLMKTHG